jgi:hypothetical protein
MNVYVEGSFVGSFDNSKWCEENGTKPWVDLGYAHVNEYERERNRNGKTEVRSGDSSKRPVV